MNLKIHFCEKLVSGTILSIFHFLPRNIFFPHKMGGEVNYLFLCLSRY